MHRALIKIVTALAVAVGLSLTVPQAPATAAAAGTTGATVTSCVELATVRDSAVARQLVLERALAKAHQKVLKKKRVLKHAKRHHAASAKIRKARKALKRARHQEVVAKLRADQALDATTVARTAAQACVALQTGDQATILGAVGDLVQSVGLGDLLNQLGLTDLLKSLGLGSLLDSLGLFDLLDALGVTGLLHALGLDDLLASLGLDGLLPV